MAIHFARCKFIQRSAGNSATRVAAYNARTIVIDNRTGERHDATRWKDDLQHHEIAMPVGAAPEIGNETVLSNMAEAAERRIDARVGRDFVLALPHELSEQGRLSLVRSFVKEHFTDNGLVVQIDIHSPHENSLNYHAHLWMPMRRLEGNRFAAKHASDLLGAVRTSHYGVFVSEAERWGQLWTIHQERFFYHHRLNLFVDPIAIDPGKRSYGPRRSWGSRISALVAAKHNQNDRLARDPAKVFAHLHDQPSGFDPRAADRFVDKHVSDQLSRSIVRKEVSRMWQADLVTRTRVATINEIARDLSSDLAKLEDRANRLRRQMHGIKYGQERNADRLVDANRLIPARRAKIGLIRQALHFTRIFKDLELHTLERWKRGQKHAEPRLKFRYANRVRMVAKLESQIKAEFEKVKDAAVAELVRRRAIAKHAREQLDQLAAEARLQKAPRQATRLRPSL